MTPEKVQEANRLLLERAKLVGNWNQWVYLMEAGHTIKITNGTQRASLVLADIDDANEVAVAVARMLRPKVKAIDAALGDLGVDTSDLATIEHD